MKKSILLASLLILSVGNVLAEDQTDRAMELAQSGVVSTNATGDSQTTVIDANGNLKMIPANTPKKAIKPVTPLPGQSGMPSLPEPEPEQTYNPGMSQTK